MPEYFKKAIEIEYVRCNYCKRTASYIEHRNSYGQECFVCKKEGCYECLNKSEWRGNEYKFHDACEEKLLKILIGDIQKRKDEKAAEIRWQKEFSSR